MGVSWWRCVAPGFDISGMTYFIEKSDALGIRLQSAQRILIRKRDELEVNKKKSEVVQAMTGCAMVGFGAVALRAGVVLSKASLGAAISGTGFVASTWYLSCVDDCVEKISLLNDEVKTLAAKVKAPVTTLEMRLGMMSCAN